METWLGELRPYPGEGRWGSGWRLAKSAARLLRGEGTLLRLALLEAALIAIVLCGRFIFDDYGLVVGNGQLGPHLLANVVLGLGTAFLMFAAASAADAAVDGLPMEAREALADLREHLGPVFAWGCISVAVAVGGWLLGDASPLLAVVLLVAWGLACSFVIPAMAVERIRPGAAIAESARAFRRRWRQLLAGMIGVSFFFVVAVLVPSFMLNHVAAERNAGHGSDDILMVAALLLMALLSALLLAILVIFTLLLLRESLDDLPGTAYAGPRLSRGTKVLRFAGGFVAVIVCVGIASAITKNDIEINEASSAPGANYEIVLANPGSVELDSGAGVYYRETEVGTVLGSSEEGAYLRVRFHVDPGYGPEETPGTLTLVGSGGGCPCLVIVPGGSFGGPDLQTS